MVLMSVVILVLCAVSLFYFSTYLIDGLTLFCRKLKLSPFFISALILAVATSTPELVNVTLSSLMAAGDFGIGNIIGANLTNLCLILGLVSVIRPIKKITKDQFKETIATLITSALFIVLLIDSYISRIDAIILLASFAFYHYYLHKGYISKGVNAQVKDLRISFIIIPLTVFGIILIGWVFVNTALYLTSALNISLSIFGLVIAALSTTMPELVTSLTAAFEGNSKIGLGNIIGSNITNFTLVVGIAALINPITLSLNNFFILALILILIFTSLMSVMAKKGLDLTRHEGLILLSAFMLYLILLLVIS
jgi:cation:H+ antiporter